jgi:Metallo-beta-lactamase superfamily
VVPGEGGLILVDPGIDGSELNQLADDLDRLGIPVVAGFSTHPHWDHLLWHSRFGDVPRYATAGGAQAAGEARERAQKMAAESASGIPLELIGLLTPLPADGGPVPGEIVEHQAHARRRATGRGGAAGIGGIRRTANLVIPVATWLDPELDCASSRRQSCTKPAVTYANAASNTPYGPIRTWREVALTCTNGSSRACCNARG